MTELLSIKAEPREIGRKSIVRNFRINQLVPGIMYGTKLKPLAVTIPLKELEKVTRKSTRLFEVEVGGTKYPAIIKDVQRDVVRGTVIHFDFQNVRLDEEITTLVPIAVTGESAGVKMGGILDILLKQIEIKCLPTDIPESITVDISSLLKINESIHISDLKVSDKIKLLHAPTEAVVAVVPPAKDEELQAATTAVVGEPELIAKGKELEEGAEGEVAADGAAAKPGAATPAAPGAKVAAPATAEKKPAGAEKKPAGGDKKEKK